MPASTSSSTINWIIGLSTIGSISLGIALVCGRKRVPKPAAAITALVTCAMMCLLSISVDGIVSHCGYYWFSRVAAVAMDAQRLLVQCFVPGNNIAVIKLAHIF